MVKNGECPMCQSDRWAEKTDRGTQICPDCEFEIKNGKPI